jgi:hypothetical protein
MTCMTYYVGLVFPEMELQKMPVSQDLISQDCKIGPILLLSVNRNGKFDYHYQFKWLVYYVYTLANKPADSINPTFVGSKSKSQNSSWT